MVRIHHEYLLRYPRIHGARGRFARRKPCVLLTSMCTNFVCRFFWTRNTAGPLTGGRSAS